MADKWRKSVSKRIRFQTDLDAQSISSSRQSKNNALEKQFLTAARLSNIPKMVECIQRGVNVNVYNIGQKDELADIISAIHLIAERGDIPALRELLKCPELRLNTVNGHGFSALHLACTFHRADLALLLLQHGSNPDFPNRLEETPLHLCLKSYSYTVFFHLIRFGANINVTDTFGQTPLSLCLLDHPNIFIAKCLIRHGADLVELEDKRDLHIFFETVLYCYTNARIDYVSLLLDFGIDVNMTDKFQRNALHFVGLTGFLPLAVVLMERGGDCKAVDASKRTPIQIAREHGNHAVADFLQKGYSAPNVFSALPALTKWRGGAEMRKARKSVVSPDVGLPPSREVLSEIRDDDDEDDEDDSIK